MKTFLEFASIKGDANVHIDEDGNLFDICNVHNQK